ncbi:hypothetical protein SAMN02745975_00851 [Geosporobacter subterraneus DSM 17957]|uniref:CARD domain-containing protein n=1 Tax=Geosporobacter subterraneus DSM 17957 TaxID=1121919 RepID=A0A1M6EW56_9FIRM|nr:hypothetical protein [Geosporobacter subterraneus]SHI89658.1 hypothetical protein SAMN02745975_00851 [Geosporobacter subterraneus DSM 17957]
MEKRFFMKKILSGVLASSMVLALGGAALAQEPDAAANSEAAAGKTVRIMQKFKQGKGFGGQLDFVAKDKAPGRGLEAVLDKLVEEGTLTQAKSEEIKKYMTEKAEARKAELEKIKAMTLEDRQKYLEEKKALVKEKIHLTEQLVQDGIITAEQKEKIEAKMKEMMPQVQGKLGHKRGMGLPLDKLVEEGKLTKEKADGIKAYFEKKAEARKAEFDQLKNMTKEERQKYFEENKKERVNILDELVKNGLLTEEEAESLKNIKMKSYKEKNNA